MDKSSVTTELQMMTGSTSTDISYLYYLVLKDGTEFRKKKEPVVFKTENTVESFDDWFNSL